MAEFIPFRGFRYGGALADLICPPYDVIDDTARERLYARSPQNFVRVEFQRTGPTTSTRAPRKTLATGSAGVLRRDDRDSFYLHEHEFEVAGRRLVRRGIFGALRLYPQSEGIVLPHELTFPKAKADRLELLRATRANTSPVFGMFADEGGSCARSAKPRARRPARPRSGPNATGSSASMTPATVKRIARRLRDRRVYIADGHHRYETALNYLGERRRRRSEAPDRYTLAFLCALEDPGLRIFATHRIVRGAAMRSRPRSRARST